MKFRRTKTAEAPNVSPPADDTPPATAPVDGESGVEREAVSEGRGDALRRSTPDETIDLVRGVRATERLRHGRTRVIDLDDAAAKPRPEKAGTTD